MAPASAALLRAGGKVRRQKPDEKDKVAVADSNVCCLSLFLRSLPAHALISSRYVTGRCAMRSSSFCCRR